MLPACIAIVTTAAVVAPLSETSTGISSAMALAGSHTANPAATHVGESLNKAAPAPKIMARAISKSAADAGVAPPNKPGAVQCTTKSNVQPTG